MLNTFRFSLLMLLLLCSQASFAQSHDTLLIDFGDKLSAFPWNNVEDPIVGSVTNLIKSDGVLSGVKIAVNDPFNGINHAGTQSPNSSIGFPSTATEESFFGNEYLFDSKIVPTGGVVLSNLTPSRTYSFSIFSSRFASDNRETQYIVAGETSDTLYLNVSANTSTVVTAEMKPNAAGNITVTASAGANNNNTYHFFYLGSMKVVYEHEEPLEKSLTLNHPVGGEFWQVGRTGYIRWKSVGYGKVKIEYSQDNGQSWDWIAEEAAGLGKYDWVIPNTPSTNCLIRISAGTDEQVSYTFEVTSNNEDCPIVILGSSTAAGTGPSHLDSAWVNKYDLYLNKHTGNQVFNLAQGGYTTYHILPTGTAIPSGVNVVIDQDKNVTKALSYNPKAIIINMPSNDAAYGFPVSAQLTNFDKIIDKAENAGVEVWICTPQPRNFNVPSKVAIQFELLDSMMARYGDKVIDFWNGIADDSGFIKSEYNSGDGVHLNDKGHQLLLERVKAVGTESALCLAPNATRSVSALKPSVVIYPNPSKEEINLVFQNWPLGRTSIQIVNIYGQVLNERELHVFSANQKVNWTPHLTKGVHFLSIMGENGSKWVEKIVR